MSFFKRTVEADSYHIEVSCRSLFSETVEIPHKSKGGSRKLQRYKQSGPVLAQQQMSEQLQRYKKSAPVRSQQQVSEKHRRQRPALNCSDLGDCSSKECFDDQDMDKDVFEDQNVDMDSLKDLDAEFQDQNDGKYVFEEQDVLQDLQPHDQATEVDDDEVGSIDDRWSLVDDSTQAEAEVDDGASVWSILDNPDNLSFRAALLAGTKPSQAPTSRLGKEASPSHLRGVPAPVRAKKERQPLLELTEKEHRMSNKHRRSSRRG